MHDSLGKNLKAAEKAIGERSSEAQIALAGSALAVIGGGVELVGLALGAGVRRLQVQNLITTASIPAKKAALAASLSITIGTVLIAFTAFFDAAQAVFASKRALFQGDRYAAGGYFASMVVAVRAGIVAVEVAAMGTATLFGPLGIAIALGLAAYFLYRIAQGMESSPLELWAKRCCFGFANEIPSIHWEKSESSLVAFGELNAITIGLESIINFRLNHTGFAPGIVPNQNPY